MIHFPNPEPRLCIIVLREVLIANDLTAIITEARPDLQVRWVTSPDDALQQAPMGARVAMACVANPPADFAASALAVRLAADFGTVIFLGHDGAEDPLPVTGARAVALPYPFSSDDVLAVLATLPVP